MRKVASAAVLVAAIALLTIGLGRAVSAQTTTPTPTASAAAKTCADFKTQAEAQAFFKANGGSRTNDPFNLDPNKNGIACEGLPGTPSTTVTPTPAPTATARPLPNNGVFSDIMAMSGLSLLEAGIALSLVSERIRSRGKRAPLVVLKMLAKAARKGRNEVALADDLYIVRKPLDRKPVEDSAVPDEEPRPASRPAPKPPAVLLTSPIEQSPPRRSAEPAGDEWTAAMTLDSVRRDDADWPYFTPPA